MLISFDPEAKALYIQLRDERAVRTIEFAPQTFVDLNRRGEPVGVELLQPGRLTIGLLKKISGRYHLNELRRISPEYLPRAFVQA